MPNPNFLPLIGSSFDNLAAQQQFYAGYNNQVESGNLARQTAAADKASQYNLQASEAQRADALHQAQMDQAAAEAAISAHTRQQERARQDYQFGIQIALQKRAEDINDKRYTFSDNLKTQQEKQAMDTVDKTAKFLAPDVNDYGIKVEDSAKNYQDAQQRMATMATELAKDIPAGVAIYNPHVQEFIPVPYKKATEVENDKIKDANAKIANAKAVYEAAATTYQTHLTAFDTLRKQAYQNGLQISKRDGKWIVYSPHHDRTYGADASNPLAAETSSALNAPDTTTQPANPFGGSMDVSAQPDATDGTGTSGYLWGGNPAYVPTPSTSVVAPVAAATTARPSNEEVAAKATAIIPSIKSEHPDWTDAQLKKAAIQAVMTGASEARSIPDLSSPYRDALMRGGSYIWNSDPVQGVRNFFKPGAPDPALQAWIHDSPAE